MTDTALRLGGMITQGVVTTTDDTGNVQFGQVRFNSLEMRDRTPVLLNYGFTSRPLPGAQVLALSANGDRSNSTIIASGDQRYRLRSLANGDVAIYNDLNQSVVLGRTGIRVDGGGLNITVSNAPTTIINGNLAVNGNVTTSGNSTTSGTLTGGTVKQGSIVLGSHTHSGVQSGGGSTGAPS